MQVTYERDGTVRHPDTRRVIGGWEKIPDPRAQPPHNRHVFKVWAIGKEEEARNYFPRYYSCFLFKDDQDKILDAGFKWEYDRDARIRGSLSIVKDTPGYYTLMKGKDVLAMGDVDEVLDAVRFNEPLYGVGFLKMSGQDLVRAISDRGQADTYQRLKYLFPQEAYEETHYLAEADGRFVGVLSVQTNPNDESVLWVKQVVVDPEYQGRKIASELVKFSFMSISDEHRPEHTVRLSSFTDEGRKKLRAVFEREAWRLDHRALEFSPLDIERDEAPGF